MLSRTKKDLTQLDQLFEPLIRSVDKVSKQNDISIVSLMLLIRFKTWQTQNNRFINQKTFRKLFILNSLTERIYLSELKQRGLIIYAATGNKEISGYNVTPKGGEVCRVVSRLYNREQDNIIRAQKDYRLSTKGLPVNKLIEYFTEPKNPNKQLKGSQPEELKGKQLKKGELKAIRAQRAEEAKRQQLEQIQEEKAKRQLNSFEDQKEQKNPFK